MLRVAICLFTFLISDVSAFALTETEEYVPSMFVTFNPGGRGGCAVIVEKKTQNLSIYAFDKSIKKILSFDCSTGEIAGAKSRSGDKKTPEGIYFFTKEYEDRYLSDVYGSRAFPLDYPNILDRIKGKNGNAIWLHGTNNAVKARSSNGCIVLANINIEKIANYITLNRTPVIIVDALSFEPVSAMKETKVEILRFLDQWKETHVNGTIEAFQNYYAEMSADISWRQELTELCNSFKEPDWPVRTELDRISIFQHNGIYTAIFDQYLKSSTRKVLAGTRKLFLKRNSKNLKIIGDEYQIIPQKSTKFIDENPLVTACKELKDLLDTDRGINEMVEGWLTAWISGDIAQYGNYYSKSFRFKHMNLKAWLRYKRKLSKKYNYIRVAKADLSISKKRGKNTVIFVQTYESSNYRDVGIKKLILKNEHGQWKIYREIWKKLQS